MQVSFDRPLAAFVVEAAHGRPPVLGARSVPPYAPPRVRTTRAQPLERVIDGAHLVETVGLLTMAMLSDAGTAGELAADIEAVVRTDVVAWTPRLYTTSCAELIEVLTQLDDTLTDVHITIRGFDLVGSTAYLEWQLAGRFSNPGFLRDDVLVEPTGRFVESAGVLVARFVGERVAEITCYYDDLSLLEQVLTGA